MKIFNKVLIGALSAAMLFGSVLTVSAAEVPSVVKDETGAKVAEQAVGNTEAGGYLVEDLDSAGAYGTSRVDEFAAKIGNPKAAIAIAKANEAGATKKSVEEFQEDIKADAPAVAAALEGKTWLTTFFDVRPYGNAATENAEVTLTVEGIGGYAKDEVTFVHYNESTGKWETLEIVKIEGNNVTVRFGSFSPSAVAVVVKAQDTTPATPAKPAAPAAAATTAANASPKTGAATNWAGYAVAAIALAACAAAFSRKKRA